jgi:hypothetical protein
MRRLAVPLFAAALLATAVSLASAETIQKGGVRVAFEGTIAPQRLPRNHTAPVTVSVATKISAPAGKPPPQLTRIAIAINRYGHLDPTGLPLCELSDIQPSSTEGALEACREAKVGEGRFEAVVGLSKRSAFPAAGKLVAFNGTYKGRPAILAHVYGTDPVPTSFTLPFAIGKAKGTYGTTLTASFPSAEGNFVTGIDLTLDRRFTYRGKVDSYASASCPASEGLPGASFAFARATYAFVGGKKLSSTLTRSCRVK